MHRLLGTAFAVAVALAGGRACQAQELCGLAIGQPLALPECGQRQGRYLPDDREGCFKRPSGPAHDRAAPTVGWLGINVALPDRPDFMSGEDAVVQLREGRVVSVSMRTHGPARDSRDFAALQDAFGRTSPRYQSTPEPVQTYMSMRADWPLPGGATVYFNSAEFGAYYGLVRVQAADAPAHQPGVWD